MLYREIIAVCSQIHTKHINTLCGQNVELVNPVPEFAKSGCWLLRVFLSVCRPHETARLQLEAFL